jgi:hypothetical protein
MGKRVAACTAVLALVVFTAAGREGRTPPSTGTKTPSSPVAPPLAWQDCGYGFQCATLKVPLDYRRPNATQIDIALIRRPAENPGTRVLDGAVMPQLGGEALLLDQATAYERALQAFFADCAARPGCPLASAGDPAAAYDELMAKIEREGVPAPAMGNRRVGPAEAESTIPAMLTVGEPVWPALATLLSRAARGDASGMLAVSDAVNMALDAQANSAIACSDLPLAPSQGLQGVPPLVERARQVAPHFLFAVNGSATACATWPIHPGRAPSLRAKGAPPIVVIGTRGDPATPSRGPKHSPDSSNQVCFSARPGIRTLRLLLHAKVRSSSRSQPRPASTTSSCSTWSISRPLRTGAAANDRRKRRGPPSL